MVRAFTDVREIEAHADWLDELGAAGDEIARGAVRDTAVEVQAEQIARVPVFEGETRDSIEIQYSDDGLTASIGPTNVDEKGRPVGFFIEYGRTNQDPQPFVRPSAKHADKALSGRLEDRLRAHLEGR